MNIKILFRIVAIALTVIMIVPSALTSCNLSGTGDTVTTADPGETPSPEETTGGTSDETTAGDVTTAEITTDEVTTGDISEVNEYKKKTYNFKDIASSIKISGRSTVAANGLAMGWSASGIEFNADCEGEIKIKITASKAGGKYAVFIDGALAKDIAIGEGAHGYTLATDLEKGVHNVRLVKRSDAETLETFMTLIVNGLIDERPADNKLFVEFIGDSITCGYGLDDESTKDAPKNDATKSWAYLVAQENGFDYSLVSIGGIGVAASTERHSGKEMGDLYPYTFYKNTSIQHSVERKADMVVIALNTNDNGKLSLFTETEYKTRAKELIAQAKAIHGEDVKIFWFSALMFDAGKCDTWAKEVIDELGGEAAGYYYTTGSPNSAGFNAHPTAGGQSSNAKVFKIFLRTTGLVSPR